MARRPKAITIGFEEILRNCAIGPFTLGGNFCEMANDVGPPGYWGINPDAAFDGYLGYGPLELSIRTENDITLIRHLTLKVFKFDRSATIVRNRQNGLSIRVDISKSWREPKTAKSRLQKAGTPFSIGLGDPESNDVSSIILVGNMHMFFVAFDGIEQLWRIDLSKSQLPYSDILII